MNIRKFLFGYLPQDYHSNNEHNKTTVFSNMHSMFEINYVLWFDYTSNYNETRIKIIK